MIYILEDDPDFASCLALYCHTEGEETKIFPDAISAISSLEPPLPSLIFLDILLPGPNGFTFLNELASYTDTAAIPIVIVTSLEIKDDLSPYGVVGILDKETLTPEEVKKYVQRYSH